MVRGHFRNCPPELFDNPFLFVKDKQQIEFVKLAGKPLPYFGIILILQK